MICGPGGVGKGTLASRLISDLPGLRLSRSWTTRGRRATEAEDAYVFVDRTTFLEAIEQKRFLEWAEFLGELYGSPTPPVDDPDDLVLEIDIQGAKTIKQLFPQAKVILVTPPSPKDLLERMEGRGDGQEKIRQRLALAAKELEEGRLLADHLVVNDDVDKAASSLSSIVESYRVDD